MKRRFKTGIKKNYKGALYIFLFGLSFICTIKLMIGNSDSTKEYLLSSLLAEATKGGNALIDEITKQISSPKYILYGGLNKIVEKNNLSVFSTIEDDDYDFDSSASEYVEDPSPTVTESPIVYLYNTHQLEEYSSSMPYDYSVKPNVMIASYIMREKLSDLGLETVVEINNVKEYINSNKLSYNKSYLATETFAREMQSKYPSIKYLIDLHRDSVNNNATYLELNGIKYARVLLVTGFEHTLAENNVGFADSLNELIEKYYPGLSRGIMRKTSSGFDGVYNPNLNGKSVLIELGGVDSKIEEVYNTVEALSKCLAELIKGEI